MSDLDYELDALIDETLNNTNVNKYISLVHPNLDLKYNSFNIAIGKPGTSKTTTFMKTMIKMCQFPNNYHMILYVSDTDTDDTVNSLMQYISIPMFRVTYDQFLDKFEKLIKLKQQYWQAIKSNNKQVAGEIGKLLFLKKLTPNIQTMIFCDDAGWVFDKKSPFNKYLCKLRHLQCTFWLNIQIWKSLEPMIRSLITTVYICKGFSRQQLQLIYRQLAVSEPFESFYRKYMSLQDYQKLLVDNQDSIVKIIN